MNKRSLTLHRPTSYLSIVFDRDAAHRETLISLPQIACAT
jgi:hypothetical protein